MSTIVEKGLESLKESVLKDCQAGENCFNENGCNHEFYRHLPEDDPKMLKMGFKTKCISVSKCFHKYCDKYKWTLDRAKHYSEITGKSIEEVIKSWEENRGYQWYMNYYQDCNQPPIEGENIIMYENWISELKSKFGEDKNQWKFVCPSCGNIQCNQDFIDIGIDSEKANSYFNCIGRHTKDKGCDWTLGGLFQIHKRVVVKGTMSYPVFETAQV